MMANALLGIVTPVFGVVLIGYLYARRNDVDMHAINQLNFDLFTPALIFHVLSNRSFELEHHIDLSLAGALVIFGSGLIAFALARTTRIPAQALVPPVMFNNSGNMGLPLAAYAFGEQGLAQAVVLFLIGTLLHVTIGIRIVDAGSQVWRQLRTPIVWSSLLGLGWSWSGYALPDPISELIGMLGQVAIPLMLFSLGVRLARADWSHWRIGLFGAMLRPLAGLAIAIPLVYILPLTHLQTQGLILFAALPPAVINYVFADRYRQSPETVAAIVIWGHLASLIIIPLTLFWIL